MKRILLRVLISAAALATSTVACAPAAPPAVSNADESTADQPTVESADDEPSADEQWGFGGEPRAPEPPASDESAAPAEAESAGEVPAVPGAMPWQSWSEGSQMAASRDQSMMVFVYADWCPRCRELDPVFDDAEVIAAAGGLVPIRQNQDEGSEWLRREIGDNNTYVPRILFLSPDGSLQSLQSSHPRYPYFYTPSMVDDLTENMLLAAANTD